MSEDKRRIAANFIKALIIIAAAALIVVGAQRILLLKSENGINQIQAFYRQKEGSVDVMFLGNSHCFCDISTGVLFDEHGIASYIVGGAEARPWVSYYQLKEALKTQRPKVIFYEASGVEPGTPFLYLPDEWAVNNNYGLKWGENRIKELRIDSEGDDFYRRLNPFNIMHGRYRELEENDFTNVRDSIDYKGFDPRETVSPGERPDVESFTEVTPICDKAEEYFRKVIALTKSEGIPLVMFISPYRVQEPEQGLYNYIAELAKSEDVPFLDFNKMYDEVGLDFEKDWADYTHLNYDGNYKFTDWLGSYITGNYDIPDRRDDASYVSWQWDAAMQRNERCDLKIKNSKDVVEIMNLTEQGYVLFAVNDGKGMISENGEILASDGEGFRLTCESGDDNFLFLEEENEGERTVSLFVNDTEHKEKYGNLLFVYDAVRHEYVKAISFE